MSLRLDPSQCITPILTESEQSSPDLVQVHHISTSLGVSQYLSDALQIFSNITQSHCISPRGIILQGGGGGHVFVFF